MPWPKGKPKTEAHRRKLSEALRGNTNSPIGPENAAWKGADSKARFRTRQAEDVPSS